MSKLNRRDTLRIIALSPVAAAAGAGALSGCRTEPGSEHVHEHAAHGEIGEAILKDGRRHVPPMFFTEDEYATVSRLVDFILPADGVSGSATEAGVPAYIDFYALDADEPEAVRVALRGGLAWLDFQCNKRFDAPFRDCADDQCRELLDMIAYPEDVAPGLEQGAEFFTLMRDLSASGFYTSETGIADVRYVGNVALPAWDGAPEEVLAHVGVSYDDWQSAT